MSETERWVRSGNRKVIAFLHGINAKDPQDYWQSFLHVVSNDEKLQEFGLFVWKYPTHLQLGGLRNAIDSLKGRTLRETAPRIKLLGQAWNTTYRTQFRDYQEVTLICHSMGGLIVKSWIIDILERGQSESLETLRHIAFYATPHNGAPITTLANWNKQLEDMQLDSLFIEDVGRRWHDHVVAWKDKDPDEPNRLYNRYIPHLVIAGLNDRVVPFNFATIRGMQTITIPGDHRQVIQPGDSHDTRYLAWRNDLEEALQGRLLVASSSSGMVHGTEYERLHASFQELQQVLSSNKEKDSRHIDWGEAPYAEQFYGRRKELTTLKQWIKGDYCRMVAVLGIGGIGKTVLATKFAEQIRDEFEFIFWRELKNALPLQNILRQVILFLSAQRRIDLPKDDDGQISLLLEYLRQHRCLLILDNMEAILQTNQRTGQYQEGYEGYGKLIQRLGEAEHQSCLLLTSREKPKEIAPLEGKRASVRCLQLSGLGQRAGREILKDKGLYGSKKLGWQTHLDSQRILGEEDRRTCK